MLFCLVEMKISVRTEREQKSQAADWLNRNDVIVRAFGHEILILLFGCLTIKTSRSVFLKNSAYNHVVIFGNWSVSSFSTTRIKL